LSFVAIIVIGENIFSPDNLTILDYT
jgi:hypothetical protein